jgi:hypothetical protein
MTDADEVEIAAEWALRGKGSNDNAYRLLECSDVNLSRENFDLVLERYSPGTLHDLPQVTIGWIPGGATSSSYVGMAIYKRPDRVAFDAGGREFVETSIFCVRYSDLAAGAVPYLALYQNFRQVVLPVSHSGRIRRRLTVAKDAERPDSLAIRAAALLLSDQPVCVLGAGEVDLEQRLRFIDGVASLLPYGMRSRLSAATWTSSTYRTHKLRLFFASADRSAGDHSLTWNRDCSGETGLQPCDAYENWLRLDTSLRIAQLADERVQMGFGWDDVGPMLHRLGIGSDLSEQRPRSTGRPSRTPPAQSRSVEDLLAICDYAVRRNDQRRFEDTLELLQAHAKRPLARVRRQRCRELIKEHQLFRRIPSLSDRLQAAYYTVLLELAFEPRLSYEAYCELEDCIGAARGRPPHPALARAILRAKSAEPVVQLVLLSAMSVVTPIQWLASNPPPLSTVVSMAADDNLRPEHGRVVFRVVVEYLKSQADSLDKVSVKGHLRERGYLVPELRRLFVDDADYGVAALRALLGVAYEEKLSETDLSEILVNTGFPPTILLVHAVSGMLQEEHAVSSSLGE